jgi:hypothetical protein
MIHKIDERINSKWGWCYEAQYDNILNTAKYNLYDDSGEYNCMFNICISDKKLYISNLELFIDNRFHRHDYKTLYTTNGVLVGMLDDYMYTHLHIIKQLFPDINTMIDKDDEIKLLVCQLNILQEANFDNYLPNDILELICKMTLPN